MDNVYHIAGFIVVWMAIFGSVIGGVSMLIPLLFRVWQRTYIFQLYEYIKLKRIIKKQKYTTSGISKGIRMLSEGRYKYHVFAKKMYNLLNSANQ